LYTVHLCWDISFFSFSKLFLFLSAIGVFWLLEHLPAVILTVRCH